MNAGSYKSTCASFYSRESRVLNLFLDDCKKQNNRFDWKASEVDVSVRWERGGAGVQQVPNVGAAAVSRACIPPPTHSVHINTVAVLPIISTTCHYLLYNLILITTGLYKRTH